MNQSKFRKHDELVILIGIKRQPKIVTVDCVFHTGLYGWCYTIKSGNNPLTIPELDLLKTFKAYLIPPDETL